MLYLRVATTTDCYAARLTNLRTVEKLTIVSVFNSFIKGAYMSVDTFFRFTCFNVEDADDPNVGLENGELAIPGNLLRREVFDPVIAQVGLCQVSASFLTFAGSCSY